MFMEQDGPVAADNCGGIFARKDGRTVQDTINLHLEYPGQWICTYFNTPQAGLQREGIEFCGTQGHLRIDRTKFEFFPPERGAAPVVVECHTDLVEEHVAGLPGILPLAQTPQGRRRAWASLGAGCAPGQSLVRTAAASPLRSRPRDCAAGLRRLRMNTAF